MWGRVRAVPGPCPVGLGWSSARHGLRAIGGVVMPGKSIACAVLGCPYLAPCPVHGREARATAWDAARGSKADRGYGRYWERFRSAWLQAMWRRRLEIARFGLCGSRMPEAPASEDSVCAAEGLATPGVVADHIRPVTGPDDPSFYKFASLQLLCRTCDQAKRQRESLRARFGVDAGRRAGGGGGGARFL